MRKISIYFTLCKALKQSQDTFQAKNHAKTVSIEWGPRSMDEGKRALGDGRAHSDEENVGEQWPRKVRPYFGSTF